MKLISTETLNYLISKIKTIFVTKDELNSGLNTKANTSHGNHVPTTGSADNTMFLRNDNTWQKVTPSNIGAAPTSHGNHVTYSDTNPAAPGTASAGTASTVARTDHVHPAQTTVSGNAGTATKLQTARTINGVSFDGTSNINIHNLTPAIINTNIDLNTIKSPGMYYCSLNATAGTLINCPTNKAFSLLVEQHAGIKQTITEYTLTDFKIYVRNYYGSWGSWERVYTSINRPTYTEIGARPSTWNPTWDDVLNKPSVFNPVIGETSTTAFRGDYGKIAYEHSQLNHAPSNAQKNSDITKSEIEDKLTGIITTHTHDSLYYTEKEIDAKLANKANLSHGNHVPDKGAADNTMFLRSDNTWAKISSSVVGTIESADKLTTARTINGTAFDGSANITTANWGTARTLTVGNSAKSVNGSGNISWSLSEIGAAPTSHGNHVPTTGTADNATFLRNDNTWQKIIPENIGSVSYIKLPSTDAVSESYTKIIDIPDAGSGNIHAEAILSGSGNYGTAKHLVGIIRVSGRSTRLVELIKIVDKDSGTVEIGYTRSGTTTSVWLKRSQYDGSGRITVLNETGCSFMRTLSIVNTSPEGYTTGSNQIIYSSLNKPTPAEIGAAPISHTHNYAGSSSDGGAATSALTCTGNSATATTLQTSRTINGTSFNGSANITTSNWGTTRTFTIGNTSKSVNGSGDVNWSLTEIGAAPSSHGTHVTYSTTAPAAPGTASAGTASTVARTDHVHPAQTTVSGNAGTATKLKTARTLTVGDTGKTFDGSGNVSWSLSEIGAASSSHTHDDINGIKITVDENGDYYLEQLI